jgi:two-component system response regulator YesN
MDVYKVLLVEDEPKTRAGLKRLIPWQKCGFQICGEAENGLQAVGMIERLAPHVVVTDIKMPLMDGLELIRNTQEKSRFLPKFILLTGYGEFEYTKAAIKFGVVDYVLKPVEEEEFELTLARSLELLEREKFRAFQELVQSVLFRNLEGDHILFERYAAYTNGVEKRFCCVIISLSASLPQLKEALMNRIVVIDGMSEISGKEPDRYTFLTVIASENAPSECNQLLELQQTVTGLCIPEGVEAKFCIGETIEGIHGLRHSYHTAISAWNYSGAGRENFIYFNKDKHRPPAYKWIPQEWNERIAEAVESGNKSLISEKIGQIFAFIEAEGMSVEAVKANLHFLTLELSRHVTHRGGDMDDFGAIISDLDRNISLAQLREFVRQMCENIAFRLNQLGKSVSVIGEIKRWLDDNYNKQVTLKEIAKARFLHPIYLGQLFHNKTGMYFNDYVHRVRIEHAKLLLVSSEMRIYEISDAVGYQDQEHFSGIFKKQEGCTPSQFRKNMKNE